MITKIKTLTLLLGIALLLGSCTKENLSKCPNVRLRIVADIQSKAATIDRYNIESVTVYVFDNDYKYVTQWEGGAYIHGQTYEVPLTLPAGTYHFVVWTNQGDVYKASHSKAQLDGSVSYADMSTGLSVPTDKTISTDIPDLHYGILTDAEVFEFDNINRIYTVIISPNTYKVNFSVRGLIPNGNTYGFTVTDNHSRYKFDNSMVSGLGNYYHTRPVQFGGNELNTSMILLGLDAGRAMPFSFENATSAAQLYSGDLIDMINKAYAAAGRRPDFSSTYEFDIVLVFSQFGVEITVNGWGYQGNPTEL